MPANNQLCRSLTFARLPSGNINPADLRVRYCIRKASNIGDNPNPSTRVDLTILRQADSVRATPPAGDDRSLMRMFNARVHVISSATPAWTITGTDNSRTLCYLRGRDTASDRNRESDTIPFNNMLMLLTSHALWKLEQERDMTHPDAGMPSWTNGPAGATEDLRFRKPLSTTTADSIRERGLANVPEIGDESQADRVTAIAKRMARILRICYRRGGIVTFDFGRPYGAEGFFDFRAIPESFSEARLADDAGNGCPAPLPVVVRETGVNAECSTCHTTHPVNSMFRNGDKHTCRDCWLRAGGTVCSRESGVFIPSGQQRIVNSGRSAGLVMCQACFGAEVVTCAKCNSKHALRSETAAANWKQTNNGLVCPDCFRTHYIECCSCHTTTARSEAREDRDEDTNAVSLYCRNCYDRMTRDRRRVIHDHDYKPPCRFKSMQGENTEVHFGVELEMECRRSGQDVESACREMRDLFADRERNLYWKHDGSLSNGAELVTHPCTLLFHQQKFPWAEVCKKAVSLGFVSHKSSSCGLHIHMSRRAIKNEAALGKICWFLEFNKGKVQKIGRRTSEQWCKFKRVKGTPGATQSKYEDAGKNTGDRYHAINMCPRNTVEFRFPKGTLNAATIIATIEFLDAVRAYAHEISWVALVQDRSNWKTFCNWLSKRAATYPEAISYMQSRKVWEGPSMPAAAPAPDSVTVGATGEAAPSGVAEAKPAAPAAPAATRRRPVRNAELLEEEDED